MYEYMAKIVRVIDADTIELSIDLGFHTWRVEKVRILDYDAPEIKLYEGVSPEEKALGIEATEHAKTMLPYNTLVRIRTRFDETGKYGRFLATIYMPDMDAIKADASDNPVTAPPLDIRVAFSINYADHMKDKGYVKE